MDNRRENYEKYVGEAINKIGSLNLEDLSKREVLWDIIVDAIKGCNDSPFKVGDDVVVGAGRYRSVVVEIKGRKLKVYDYKRQSASHWYEDGEVMFTTDYHISRNVIA